ncbi:hypothetical protein [Mesorhizobium australicum]
MAISMTVKCRQGKPALHRSSSELHGSSIGQFSDANGCRYGEL